MNRCDQELARLAAAMAQWQPQATWGVVRLVGFARCPVSTLESDDWAIAVSSVMSDRLNPPRRLELLRHRLPPLLYWLNE